MIANRVREMILSGDLAPGERITEAGLASRLGMSRTPIRNVLPGLAAEGLLETAGRRGFAVKAFGEQDSLQALELRALLEGQSARLLARNGLSADVLRQLQDCLDEGDRLFTKRYLDLEDERQYGEMNQRFHDIVVDGSGWQMLRAMVDRLNLIPFVAPSVIVFDQIGLRKAFDLLFRAHGHHHAIVDAIRNRDGERAEQLFREHANQQRISMFARRAHLGLKSDGIVKPPRKRRRKADPAPDGPDPLANPADLDAGNAERGPTRQKPGASIATGI